MKEKLNVNTFVVLLCVQCVYFLFLFQQTIKYDCNWSYRLFAFYAFRHEHAEYADVTAKTNLMRRRRGGGVAQSISRDFCLFVGKRKLANHQ